MQTICPVSFVFLKQEHIFMDDARLSVAGIRMRKQQTAIIALTLWLTIVSLFMLLRQPIDFKVLIVLWFMGILVIMALIEPQYVKPKYLRYIRFFTVAGIVIFVVIVALKVMEILGLEIVF
jgi:hypothetical protein